MLLRFKLTASKNETSLRKPEAFLTNEVGWLVIGLGVVDYQFNIFAFMFTFENETNKELQSSALG